MKFDIHLDDEDYIKFNIFHAFHSKSGKKSILMGRTLMFLFSIIAIIIFVLAKAERNLIITEVIILTIVSIIYCFCYPKTIKKRVRRCIYKLKAEGTLPYSTKETIEFQDTDILEVSEKEVIRTDYSEIIAFYITDDYIYLYKGAIRAIIIPYHCLGNKKEEVIEHLKSKISCTM